MFSSFGLAGGEEVIQGDIRLSGPLSDLRTDIPLALGSSAGSAREKVGALR